MLRKNNYLPFLVIVYKIDRLTRSPKDFYQLIEIFEKHNVSFLSTTERFDTSTPSGRLLRNIMLTFAQFERELISERIRDKMFERSKKGFWNGGHPPFGYKKEDKKLVVVPHEVEIIRKIFEGYVLTKSLNAIYKQLKEERLFNRAGLPMAKTAISGILDNVVYIG
ncbi:MAG: recombinase family protein, partial [Candidatus Margulisbacteria bacterium]|nr:recombinase family protein [Candidatus Margulisiibacteriota bacterium]